MLPFELPGLGPLWLSCKLGLVTTGVLLLLVIGTIPSYPYSRKWGYGPSGILGIILVILVVLMLMGMLDF